MAEEPHQSSRAAPAFKKQRGGGRQNHAMRFDTKIAIAVRGDLEQWQKLNVTAFLASAIAFGVPETAGKPYEDGSGNRYLEMFRQPVLVYAADAALLTTMRERAAGRGLPMMIYTEELFSTGNDDDNRAAVGAVTADELNLVGVAVHGPRNAIDKVCKGAKLHPLWQWCTPAPVAAALIGL
jgi:hypothetical protein